MEYIPTNFSTFPPILKSFVALSILTKSPGPPIDEAGAGAASNSSRVDDRLATCGKGFPRTLSIKEDAKMVNVTKYVGQFIIVVCTSNIMSARNSGIIRSSGKVK